MDLPVHDPDDDRLRPFMGLRDHAARQTRELPGGDMASCFMAEGNAVISRALHADHRLLAVLVDERRRASLPELAADVPVYLAGERVLTAVCGRPQLRDPIGCFARPQPADAAALVSRSNTVLLLEGIVNPTNVGVIVRNAAGLGVEAILADPTTCDPLYRRAVRVSMGAVFAIPHARLEDVPTGLDLLRASGLTSVALTPDPGAVDIRELAAQPRGPTAILLGAEGSGLDPATLATADVRARIPMAAGVDSINVGAAAAIACYALGSRPA